MKDLVLDKGLLCKYLFSIAMTHQENISEKKGKFYAFREI